MIRLLLLLLLWVLQVVLVLLLTDSGWIERQVRREQTLIATNLGTGIYDGLRAAAEDRYARWFVDSGAVEGSYRRWLPAKNPQPGKDLEIAPRFFTWLEHRLDAGWWLAYQASYRLQLIGTWAFFLLVLAIAALADGVVRWQVKRANHEPPRGDRYIIGGHVLLLVLVAPLFYLFLPIVLHPLAVPLWGCAFALAIVTFSSNLQHRV